MTLPMPPKGYWEYRVIEGTTGSVSEEVSKLLISGWELHGKTIVTAHHCSLDTIYQAVKIWRTLK